MRKVKYLCLLLAVLLIAGMSFRAQANEADGGTYEVAILMDISGSMTSADPNRVSIEAAKAFAYYYPAQAEYFNISVIVYNTNVVTAIESVDVSSEEGMLQYQDCMTQMGKLKANESYKGIKFWNGWTDIGKAMVEAEKLLANSNADKKAVMLFTDGKIDLGSNNTGEAESHALANSSTNSFAEKNIPVYTVGLNYNDGVDSAFLQDIADRTQGEYQECKSADVLMDLFQKMYAYFVGGSVNSGGVIQTKPNVESTHSVNIYGQAISEANLVLFSNAVINSYTVTNPNGVVVAQMKSDGTTTTSPDCIIHRNDLTVNVKLLYPMDGYWHISFTSETAGTVQIGEIYLYSLEVAHDMKTELVVEETTNLNLALYNKDKGFHITTKELYENARCTVNISGNGINDTYEATLNNAKNGYTLPVCLTRPGEYKVSFCIASEQFSVTTDVLINVLAPKFTLSAATTECDVGDQIEIIGQLIDPLTGKPMKLPEYLSGGSVLATCTCAGKTPFSLGGVMNEDGSVRFSYTPNSAGRWEVAASIVGFFGEIQAQNSADVTVYNPNMVVTVENKVAEKNEEIVVIAHMRGIVSGQKVAFPENLVADSAELIVKRNGETIATIKGVLMDDQTIRFAFSLQEAGDYSISALVICGVDMLVGNADGQVTIWWPNMRVELATTSVGIRQMIEGTVTLRHPTTNEMVVLENYLSNGDLVATILQNGEVVKTIPLDVTANATEIVFSYVAEKVGNFAVVISGGVFTSEQLSFSVEPSTIQSVATLEDIEGSVLFGTVSQEIDLREFFKDSDGDALQFAVDFEGKGIDCELKNGILYVEAIGGAKGEITIRVADGQGAECEKTFAVHVKSSMPLFIAGIVFVVLLAIGIPVALVVINKRRIPRMRYRIKIALNGDYAIFDINKAAAVRLAKPVMTVREILNMTTLATRTAGNMSLAAEEKMVSTYGNKINISGFAFKEGIRVILEDGKERVFMKSVVSVPIKSNDDEDWDVSFAFGKTSDFREDDE